jgi:hypothetical protein
VIDFEAAFQEHFFDVPVTQRIAQVPGDSLKDQPGLEMAALEVILGLALQFLGNGIQNHGTLHDLPEPFRPNLSRFRKLLKFATAPVKLIAPAENLRLCG